MVNAVATIGGFPILNATDFRWELTTGVTASTAVAILDPKHATDLLKGALRPVDLVVGPVTFKKVYVVEEAPGLHPAQGAVRIADRRWFWSRQFISRSYNMRKTIGVKRVKVAGSRPELDPLVDQISFHPWSLKNQISRFTAKDVLNDVLRGDFSKKGEGVLFIESESGGATAPLVIESVGGKRPLPIQDLVIESQGHEAVQRVLDYIPGAAITVDPDGTVRVLQQASRKEREILEKKLGGELDKRGHVKFIGTNERIRPKKVHVYFTKIHELRIDFDEDDTGAGRRGGDDRRFSQNVMPLPDLELSIGGVKYSRGTWVPIDQRLFNAWGPLPKLGNLTQAKLLRWLAPRRDVWAIIAEAGRQDPDSDWGARISAIMQHFRRTFRINPRWRSRMKQWYPFLVGTVDVVTGERAPAKVFMDYTVISTARTTLSSSGSDPLRYDLPYKPYTKAKGAIGAMTASPAKFRVVDQDQGIFSIDMQMDQFRLHEMLIPGTIENSPTAGVKKNELIAWNMVLSGVKAPTLKDGHQMSVLFSAQSGSPNRRDRLHKVTVGLKDVRHLLTEGSMGGASVANGPDMHVRVGPGLEQARVVWTDGKSRDIETSFGVTEGSFNIDDLIVNLSTTDVGASLNELALGVAARIYAGYEDRFEGRATFNATEQRIEGYIESMGYSITQRGATIMDVKTRDRIDDIWDPMSFMPSSVVNFVERIASVHGVPT